jgi:hypothetical protein
MTREPEACKVDPVVRAKGRYWAEGLLTEAATFPVDPPIRFENAGRKRVEFGRGRGERPPVPGGLEYSMGKACRSNQSEG